MKNFDIVIVGSGPGGYVAAIRAAQLGAKVGIVEKDEIGGTCLNWGCIPTKSLINSLETTYEKANYLEINLRKDEVVKKLRSGIEGLFRARKVEVIKGTGQLKDRNAVDIVGAEGKSIEQLESKNIIVATGSRPLELSNLKFNGSNIISSNEIINLKEVPKDLIIVGGGVIGCEFANIFWHLGTKITIIEMMDMILPGIDQEISRKLEIIMKKKGIDILTKTKVEECNLNPESVTIGLSNGSTLSAQKILVCVGRRLNSDNLGLENLKIKTENNKILVNQYLQTNIGHVYAVGDVIGGLLLAHVASYEGTTAVENILKEKRAVDYRIVPNCIFTHPEIGCLGLTEEVAKQMGLDIKVGRFPFTALGKAQVIGKTDGFLKIIAEAKSDKILGAAILGPGATELIATVATAMQFEATTKQLSRIIFAHPTLSEALGEVASSVHKSAIHSL